MSGSREDLFESKKEKDGLLEKLKAVGVVAGLALVGWSISKLASAGSEEEKVDKKMMKAPGKDFYIYRDDFERDPASYFRNHRH